MSALSWEDMARQVLVAGRPADVTSAALGWQALLGNIDEVKRLVEADVRGLGESWKGPAYEAFRTHMEGLTRQAEAIADGAREPGNGRQSIVTVLQTAASDLERAQTAMPIPQGCVGDVMAARNGDLVIDAGLFEASVRADFAGSWPMEKVGQFNDWVGEFFNNNTEDARKAYNQVSDEYGNREREVPGSAGSDKLARGEHSGVDLEGTTGTGGAGRAPGLGDGSSTGRLGGGPSLGAGDTGFDGAGFGSGAHPDLSSGVGGYDGSAGNAPGGGYDGGSHPGAGGRADDTGTRLAGAGGGTGTLTGVSSGFGGGGGGLPSATGLGTGGGGPGGSAGLNGAGMVPGGGALGRPVSPVLPPMMGGGAGAGGRGGSGGGRGGSTGARAAGGGVRGGLAGMGHGPADGEEESAHSSWLKEDEDVWGVDDDGGPDGVLR
ncbi:hypothetical protein [Micromonospora sp. NPDC049662]|uniref:WXG100 family type VII secretion target n=1 Tax=Micromonospora sp. NPDC049662 TaxID=3155397 RepID=UPI00341C6315